MQISMLIHFVLFIHFSLWKYSESAAPVINNLPDTVSLHEDSPEVLLFTFNVTDADGDSIACAFGPGSTPGVGTSRFDIRYVPGTTDWGIYSKENVYDFSSQPTYNLNIECTANGEDDTKTLTVNLLENNVPVINNLPDTINITVTAVSLGDILYTVNVTDAENDPISLAISCNPATPVCPLDIFDSGTIVLNADISSTTVSGYDVTVSVSDDGGSGTPQILTIIFSGANNQPAIQNLGSTINVPENSALGDMLETTTCTDNDVSDTLSYSMSCTPASGLTYFQINSSSGELSTSWSSSINYEFLSAAGNTSFTCTVTCSDGDASDTATVNFVVTDVNESPSFSQNGYSILADEGPGGTVLQTSGYTIIDEDSGDTDTFSFDCGTSTSYFSIDPDNGILSFGSDYDVDDGVRPTSASCNITVTDSGGLNDTVPLSITINNINDNVPVFLQNSYSWFISEGAAIGATIGTVSATDNDLGTYGVINYSLDQSGLASEFFGIDQTGKVYVHSSLATVGGGVTLTFDVLATDGGGNVTSVTATLVTVATTTTTTTTTTDRYKTFFDDTRNIVWFTASCLILLITAIVTFWMCCTYSRCCVPKSGGKRFNFKCCRCWREGRRKPVQITEPIPIEEPREVPVPVEEKPKPEPEGFRFWSTTGAQWDLS